MKWPRCLQEIPIFRIGGSKVRKVGTNEYQVEVIFQWVPKESSKGSLYS